MSVAFSISPRVPRGPAVPCRWVGCTARTSTIAPVVIGGRLRHATTLPTPALRNPLDTPSFNQLPKTLEPRPSDPAYFTGNPKYYAALQVINALIRKYRGTQDELWVRRARWQEQLRRDRYIAYVKVKRSVVTDYKRDLEFGDFARLEESEGQEVSAALATEKDAPGHEQEEMRAVLQMGTDAFVDTVPIDFHFPPETYAALDRAKWLTREQMDTRLNMGLKEDMYTEFVHRLDLLRYYSVTYADDQSKVEINTLLQRYLRPGETLSSSRAALRTLDEFGRAFARGSRKTAEAFVWMTRAAPRGDSTSTPGGQIYVNGKQLALYFETEAHRKVCVKPFDVVPSTTVGMEDSGVGAFNVWAIVRGGGKSGQSDAVAVAIARALSIHISPGWGDDAPEWVGSLRQMTKVDTRQVERKKTGQPKARKKYTWVKR